MNNLSRWLLVSLGLLGSGASRPLTAPSAAERNFEVFWRTFRDHYALFALYGVDWEAAYRQYQPLVTAQTTPATLDTMLMDMVRPLADGHIYFLRANQPFYKGQPRRNGFNTAFGKDKTAFWNTASTVLQRTGFEPMRGRGPVLKALQPIYFTRSSTVGYVRLTRCFFNLTGAIGSARQERADSRLLLASFDTTLARLADCPTLVLDFRANGGGHSGVAMARRFCQARRLTHYKATRQPGGYEQFTLQQACYLEPLPGQKSGPAPGPRRIFLLVNDATASAAEDFTVSMSQEPGVVTIGSNTRGMLSDMYASKLSNGLMFTLSSQRYYAADRTLLEGIGIAPQINVADDPAALARADDPVLARSLALAAAKP